MLKDLIKSLIQSNISEIVVEKEVINTYSFPDDETIHAFNDVRSAVFYAFGESIAQARTVAVIVSGESLPSAYTGITEAWFQKANIVIIALYDNFKSINCSYLERCTLKNEIYSIDEIKSAKIWDDMIGEKGPVILNVFLSKPVPVNNYDYMTVLKTLDKIINYPVEVFCYGISPITEQLNNITICNIDMIYKYGVISKYIGYNLMKPNSILCCPSSIVMLDSNVFRNRYSNPSMKIVLIDENNDIAQHKIDKWISSNGWICLVSEDVNHLIIDEFLKSSHPAVLIVKGGK